MKRTLSVLILIAMLLTTFAMPMSGAVQAQVVETGTYLVLFEDTYIPDDFVQQVADLGGTIEFSHEVGIAIVSGLTEAAAAELGERKDVSVIEPDSTFQLESSPVGAELDALDALPESPEDPTAASRYSRQWNMRAIDADLAWAEGRLGSPEVTVAILDTGIDYMYPDLAGLVDLDRSISFVPEDDLLVDFFFPGRHYVTDLHYHGTHVAATVASNAYILAGVTSKTTLMGVKVCSVYGSCPFTAVVQGVLYASDNGADVMNLSLGGNFLKAGNGAYVGFINRMYNYANRMGATVVVSAGNDAIDMDHDGNNYKTYCSAPNTICVSATGPTYADDIYEGPWYDIDAPAYYTNYGSSAISVAAPGGNSGGYVWAGCSTSSLRIPVCQTAYYILGLGGTSMAAPHVSGLAALVVEDVGPNPGRVVTIIQKGADDLGKPGVDPYYGKGRINVWETID